MSINATNVILEDGTGAIVGQGEMTITRLGTPIDISNKSNGDWRTLLAGEKSGKGVDIAINFVHNLDPSYLALRKADLDATLDPYTLTIPSTATTDESFTGSFMVHGLSDAAPHGDKYASSMTLSSSGEVAFTDAVI